MRAVRHLVANKLGSERELSVELGVREPQKFGTWFESKLCNVFRAEKNWCFESFKARLARQVLIKRKARVNLSGDKDEPSMVLAAMVAMLCAAVLCDCSVTGPARLRQGRKIQNRRLVDVVLRVSFVTMLCSRKATNE